MSDAANILLVDDEPGMLRYIRTLLEVDEHKVETASTGEEAVETLKKYPNPASGLASLRKRPSCQLAEGCVGDVGYAVRRSGCRANCRYLAPLERNSEPPTKELSC